MPKGAIIDEAEKFIDQWTKGEVIVIQEQAQNLTSTIGDGKNIFGRPKKHTITFRDDLGQMIAIYQFQKDFGSDKELLQSAFDLTALVQKARAFGAIKDKNQQQKDYQQDIERLKERLDSLQKLNDRLVIDNKRLHNLVDKNSKTTGQWGTEIGDVKKP